MADPLFVLQDMINMLKLGFTPKACCWVHRSGEAQSLLAVCVLPASLRSLGQTELTKSDLIQV